MARKSRIGELKRRGTPSAAEGTEFSILVEVSKISPDPDQPRHDLLPPSLRSRYFSGELLPQDLMLAWFGMYIPAESVTQIGNRHETGINTWLDNQANNRTGRFDNLYNLTVLADQIAAIDQTTAISVRSSRTEGAPFGAKYLITTGERRYWAYIILDLFNRRIYGENEGRAPDRMKAVIESEGQPVRLHQIVENISREGFNAVELALSYQEVRTSLATLHGVETVAWKEVESFLGINKRYRTYVTNILALSDETKTSITTHGFTERAVRPIVRLKDYPALQKDAINHLIRLNSRSHEEDDGSLPPLEQFVSGLLATDGKSGPQKKSRKPTSKPPTYRAFKRETGKLLKTATAIRKQVVSLPEKDKIKAREEALKLKQIVDGILEDLEN